MGDETLVFFLWLAVGTFVITAVIQLLFPVRVYEQARASNLSDSSKGRFAYTIESLYNIKTKGLDADGRYWWHITWFNTAISFSVSAVVVFWAFIIYVVVIIIIAVVVLAALFSN